MAYPATIDSIPDPIPTNKRNAPSLANGQVAQNDAIEATQTYLGVSGAPADSSTITGRVKVLEAVPAALANNAVTPAINGLKLWTYDPALGGGTTTTPTVGTLYVCSMWTLSAMTITNLHAVNTTNNGTSLGYMALYSAAGAKLSQSASQVLGSNGFKTFALGAPQAVAAGVRVFAVLWNQTASVSFTRAAASAVGTGQNDINLNLVAATLRAATADTGVTTTSPATLGAMTGQPTLIWMGAS